MVFSFFGKNKQDDSLVLLIDIGSASVGASFARIRDGKPTNILATVREDIVLQDSLSSSRFLLGMLHALERALKAIQKEKKGRRSGMAPAHVFCTLSSPWFVLKTRHIRIGREKPFQVTENALEAFVTEDIERLKTELKDTLPASDVAIIEKKIIHMLLNGYEIRNPYGQTTDRVELMTTVSISSKRVIKSIEHKIGQIFHTTALQFGVFPVAAFSAIRDIFPNDQDFLFLDVTGEATDVSLINNDVLLGTISFPFGKNFFIREISSSLHTPHTEASSLFAMFLEGVLDEERRKRIEGIVAHATEEWLARFEKSVSGLAAQGSIPRKVFFTVDANVAKLFLDAIARAKPSGAVNRSFEVDHLDQFILSSFVTFEPEVWRDPFIVVEALLATKVITLHNK